MDSSNAGQSRRFAGAPTTIDADRRQYNFAKGPSPIQDAGDTPIPWNIMNFYNQNQDPWHPPNIITPLPTESQVCRKLPGSSGFQPNDPSFQGFRNNHLPSECDTLPDSGYEGSRPTYSIDNTSVYEEDRSPEARLATQRIESLQIQADSSNETQHQLWSQPRHPTSIATASGNGDKNHYCQDCGVWLRTKSEFKKHKLRHVKPFHCDVPNCMRAKEGFGTKNDLDRHKKSVHSDSSVAGARYVCRLEQCGIKDPVKQWPRADNFRSHLQRVHKVVLKSDDNMDEYIYRQPEDRVPSRQDLQGVGSYLTSQPGPFNFQSTGTLSFDQTFTEAHVLNPQSRGDLRDMQQSLDSLLPGNTENIRSNLTPVQEDEEVYIQPDVLSETTPDSTPDSPAMGDDLRLSPALPRESPGLNDEDTMDVDTESVEQNDHVLPMPATSHSRTENEQTGDDGSGFSQDPYPECDLSESESSDVRTAGASSSQSIASRLPASFSRGLSGLSKDDPTLLEILRGLPKELLESALKSDSISRSSESSSRKSSKNKNKHVCSECSKLFNRPCELKKHMKRHEKPYGCTFDNCSKTFGSKNDWKRHESSQHWHLETWKCDCKKTDGEPCDKGFLRRESFKNHLQHNHTMTDSKQIDEKLENCRIGRHCESRFWCGFCEKLIEIGPEKVNAWTLRCNHIDDHFCGRRGEKKNITYWKPAVSPEERHEDDSVTSSDNTSTGGPSLKRKPDQPLGPQAHKRQQVQTLYMWNCCQCNTVSNFKTASSCIECNHQRCEDYCALEGTELPLSSEKATHQY